MRAWTCFRVALESECRRIGALDTLKRSIEQRFVRCLEVGRKRVRVDREAMVLACDQYAVVTQILHWVICPVVTEPHLYRLRATGEGE